MSSVSASSASYASISIFTIAPFELDEDDGVEDEEVKRERPESSANSASRPYGRDLTAVLVNSSSPIAGGIKLLRWIERGSLKKKGGGLGRGPGAKRKRSVLPREKEREGRTSDGRSE